MAKRGPSSTLAAAVTGAVVLLGPSYGNAGDATQEKPAGPEAALRSLMQEYGTTSGEFRKATTDAERKAAVEHLYGFPARFVELAEKDSEAASAVDVLVEAVRAL